MLAALIFEPGISAIIPGGTVNFVSPKGVQTPDNTGMRKMCKNIVQKVQNLPNI